MILIADSGSTKTDWVLVDDETRQRFRTIGYNPLFIGTEGIVQSLTEGLLTQLNAGLVKTVFFYGADCAVSENASIVKQALEHCFEKASVHVGHDLLAAARALLGNSAGFSAILGTGSNTCVYDGEKVVENIPSLGYLLGDEGSGTYIGRKILRDYLRKVMPGDLQVHFQATWNYSEVAILNGLYQGKFPNRFLAAFCQFAHTFQQHAYIQEIIWDSFRDFFENRVLRYKDYQSLRLNCIGSVGFVFREQLKKVAAEYNMPVGKIVQSPIEALVNFHLINSVKENNNEVSNSSGR